MAYGGILPEIPSFGQSLAKTLGAGLSQGISNATNFAQQMALEKEKRRTTAHEERKSEKIKNINTALGTIQEMRGLIHSAGPSNWVQGLFPGETAKNRAQLAQLGTSLIPLVAAGVPIRNQKEFEQYRKIITDPNAKQSDIEGALGGLESLFTRSLDNYEENFEEKEEAPMKKSSSKVKMKAPDGTEREVDKSRVKDLMKKGAVVIK